MMNGYVSIAEEGISPNIVNHRELKAKIFILFSPITPKCRYDLCYLKIKRSHHYYQTEGNGGVGQNLTCLETSSCDVPMEIADAAAIVHIWCEPSKLQSFNYT